MSRLWSHWWELSCVPFGSCWGSRDCVVNGKGENPAEALPCSPEGFRFPSALKGAGSRHNTGPQKQKQILHYPLVSGRLSPSSPSAGSGCWAFPKDIHATAGPRMSEKTERATKQLFGGLLAPQRHHWADPSVRLLSGTAHKETTTLMPLKPQQPENSENLHRRKTLRHNPGNRCVLNKLHFPILGHF